MRHLFLLAALFCTCISYAQIRVQERLPKSKTGFALTTAKACLLYTSTSPRD